MFYVKSQINDETTIKIELNCENVFTICPECGKEHSVDLDWFLKHEDVDLLSTKVWCPECSEKRHEERR